MDKKQILVVEDEDSFVDALTVGLEREGFIVKVAINGTEALKIFEEIKPDLILLDIMLPEISGIDVCREIRTKSDVPIIMVTAKGEEIDTVLGLEIGADDYVTKPYRLRELVARIRSVLRRAEDTKKTNLKLGNQTDNDSLLEVGNVSVNLSRHEVLVDDQQVMVPLKEFDLLVLLMENPNRVLTRDTIIDRIWGFDYVGDTKTLDVHIKRLRNKIEANHKDPKKIITVRGVGYKYNNT
ncbi:response regulator transcription factor [Acidimicrobiaceae bacterium]|nr:response regulator transcription factor [Acidimicrobiaceae bacterium]